MLECWLSIPLQKVLCSPKVLFKTNVSVQHFVEATRHGPSYYGHKRGVVALCFTML